MEENSNEGPASQTTSDDLLMTEETATTESQEWMTIAEAEQIAESPKRSSRKAAVPKKSDPQPK